ncbi:MAG: hypothetical protein A2168_04270 [Planctomycetes bacterium RBG_13_50_24]|nr:MAG: hypothetical protein A2168_04270 [Planctomycetes bacterium RBG_13_50_24]
MKGWRTKLIFLLIVYFAGFATAIYMLAPAPEGSNDKSFDNISSASAFDSQEFAKSFNAGMHKCLAFGKDAACHTAEFIKEKLKEMRET